MKDTFKLCTDEIKEFLRISDYIVSHGSFNPLLNYILLDGCRLIKTNTNFFCKYIMSESAEYTLLLDEITLSNFITHVTSSHFDVIVEDDTVLFHAVGEDGKPKKLGYQKKDHTNYPKFPPVPDYVDKVMFDNNVLSAIGRAKLMIDRKADAVQRGYVNISGNCVLSFSKNFFYQYKSDIHIPDNVFSFEISSVISGFSHLDYYLAGNFHFFENDRIVYGFRVIDMPPYKYDDFKPMLDSINKDMFVEVSRKDMLSFCDTISKVTNSENPICSIRGSKDGLDMKLVDAEYGTCGDMSFSSEGTYNMRYFKFDPVSYASFLRALPYDKICLSPWARPMHMGLWTKEDDRFLAIIPEQS